MSLWQASKHNHVSLSSPIVEQRYVFTSRRWLKDLSALADVTGNVANTLKITKMFGKACLSHNFSASDTVEML